MSQRISLSRSFRVQMFVYHAFGLCPTKMEERGPSFMTPGLVFVSILHLVLATAQLNVVIQLHDFIFYSRDTFGMINDTFKYCGVAVAYYSIIIETALLRSEHVQFWQSLIQIKWDAAKREHKHSVALKLEMPRRLVLQFGGTALVMFLVELTLVPLMINNQQSLNFWGVYSLSLVLSRIRHLQLIHYVDILDRELIGLAKEMQKVVNYSRFDTISPAMADFIVSRIKWAQWNYSLIYDMSLNINEMFGWSQLANFLHSFVQILADLYWIYWRFYNEYHYSFSRYAVCIVPSLGIVVMVFAATNRFQLRSRSIGFLIHYIKRDSIPDIRLNTLIEAFSLQILHQPIRLNAKGFFILDFGPLRDMIAALTTYMVFFIQFTPKFKTKLTISDDDE